MKSIHEFLAPPAQSCKRDGPHVRIVMSSRVRLARNLKGLAFPGWAKKVERIKALELIRPAVESLSAMAGAFSESMLATSACSPSRFASSHIVASKSVPIPRRCANRAT